MMLALFILADMNMAPNTMEAQKTISTTVNKQMAQQAAASMEAPPGGGGTSSAGEMMIISPLDRAGDLVQAYTYMRQHNVAATVSIVMKDKSVISNILDIEVMKNGTMIVFKVSTLQGEKYLLAKTEDIESLVIS